MYLPQSGSVYRKVYVPAFAALDNLQSRRDKMSIIYDEKYKTITLHTRNTTYQMQIDRYGFLLHLYYGKTAEGCMDYLFDLRGQRFFPEILMMRVWTVRIPWTPCRRSSRIRG